VGEATVAVAPVLQVVEAVEGVVLGAGRACLGPVSGEGAGELLRAAHVVLAMPVWEAHGNHNVGPGCVGVAEGPRHPPVGEAECRLDEGPGVVGGGVSRGRMCMCRRRSSCVCGRGTVSWNRVPCLVLVGGRRGRGGVLG